MAVERFPVEAGHIMMFARAVGDPNPVYYDDGSGEVIAPPTFVQSGAQFDPDYRLRPKIGEPWFGSGGNPTGVPPSDDGDSGYGGFLHAEQHFEYHRHLRPGDTVSARSKPGKTWEKESKRAGKLSFSETITEYIDQNGEVVITARSVGVKTERPVDQG